MISNNTLAMFKLLQEFIIKNSIIIFYDKKIN